MEGLWVQERLMDCEDAKQGYEFLTSSSFSPDLHKSMTTYWRRSIMQTLKHLMTDNEEVPGGGPAGWNLLHPETAFRASFKATTSSILSRPQKKLLPLKEGVNFKCYVFPCSFSPRRKRRPPPAAHHKTPRGRPLW